MPARLTRPSLTPGLYHALGVFGSATNPSPGSTGRQWVFPIDVPRPTRFDRIACVVATAGSGSSVRLGIYADNGRSYPGKLLLDAGTVAADATGIAEINIAATLGARRYWLTLASAFTTTGATIRGFSTVSAPGVGAASAQLAANGTALGYFTSSGVTGALPATYPDAQAATVTVPGIWLRAA